MEILLIILMAIVGAAWRHTMGGWNGPLNWARNTFLWGPDDKGVPQPRRSFIMAAGWLLSWPLFITTFPAILAVIGVVLIDLFWRFGHDVNSPKIWLRYGPFALPWVLAKKWWGDKPERKGDFLNNWMGVGEAGAGAMFYATLTAVALALS
jgi:hypothetical protein